MNGPCTGIREIARPTYDLPTVYVDAETGRSAQPSFPGGGARARASANSTKGDITAILGRAGNKATKLAGRYGLSRYQWWELGVARAYHH